MPPLNTIGEDVPTSDGVDDRTAGSGLTSALASAREAQSKMDAFLRTPDSQRHIFGSSRDDDIGADSDERSIDSETKMELNKVDTDDWGMESDLRHMTAFEDEMKKELEKLKISDIQVSDITSSTVSADHDKACDDGQSKNTTRKLAIIVGANIVFIAGVFVGYTLHSVLGSDIMNYDTCVKKQRI